MNEKTILLRFSKNASSPKKNPTAKSEKRRAQEPAKVEWAETSDGLEIKVWGLGRKASKEAIIKAIKETVKEEGGEAEEEWS